VSLSHADQTEHPVPRRLAACWLGERWPTDAMWRTGEASTTVISIQLLSRLSGGPPPQAMRLRLAELRSRPTTVMAPWCLFRHAALRPDPKLELRLAMRSPLMSKGLHRRPPKQWPLPGWRTLSRRPQCLLELALVLSPQLLPGRLRRRQLRPGQTNRHHWTHRLHYRQVTHQPRWLHYRQGTHQPQRPLRRPRLRWRRQHLLQLSRCRRRPRSVRWSQAAATNGSDPVRQR